MIGAVDFPGGMSSDEAFQRQRDRGLKDFRGAIAFVNAVADLAEDADHHPDLLIHGYNKVTVTLTTHDAGGLTQRDFLLAAQIERA